MCHAVLGSQAPAGTKASVNVDLANVLNSNFRQACLGSNAGNRPRGSREAVDEPLCISTLREEADRSRALDGRTVLGAQVHRQAENLNRRQTLMDATRRLHAVHSRHRHVHHDDVGMQRMRLRDLRSVRRRSDGARAARDSAARTSPMAWADDSPDTGVRPSLYRASSRVDG
jgi:hypothetical protein